MLGVSLTGIMDHPILSKVSEESKKWLNSMRDLSILVNKNWSEKLGIQQSAAITCVKPSGCQILDNKIKTSNDDLSLREIFEILDIEEKDISNLERKWLNINLEKLPKIYDENNQLQKITGLFVNGKEAIYEIEFEDGNIYGFTGNHKLKTTNGWKRVDELNNTDEIISF